MFAFCRCTIVINEQIFGKSDSQDILGHMRESEDAHTGDVSHTSNYEHPSSTISELPQFSVQLHYEAEMCEFDTL